MSTSYSSTAGLPWCCARLAWRPARMLSTTRTRKPRSTRRSTMWLPLKPAPPVTTATSPAMPLDCRLDLQVGRLDHLHVHVARVGHRVRDLTALEGAAQVDDRVLDRALRGPAELALDLGRRDVV